MAELGRSARCLNRPHLLIIRLYRKSVFLSCDGVVLSENRIKNQKLPPFEAARCVEKERVMFRALDDAFYEKQLARSADSEIEVPEKLLLSMAILIGRSANCYFDPMECKALASLVALALDMGSNSLCQCGAEFHSSNTEPKARLHERILPAISANQGLARGT